LLYNSFVTACIALPKSPKIHGKPSKAAVKSVILGCAAIKDVPKLTALAPIPVNPFSAPAAAPIAKPNPLNANPARLALLPRLAILPIPLLLRVYVEPPPLCWLLMASSIFFIVASSAAFSNLTSASPIVPVTAIF